MSETRHVPIKTDSDLLFARKVARDFGQQSKIGNQNEIRLATIVSELCRNILKYAGKGECIFHALDEGKVRCEFIDSGPGILNLEDAFKDGFSTSGTLGIGLPGAKRLSDFFEISSGEEGTKIIIEIHASKAIEDKKTGILKTHNNNSKRVGISRKPFEQSRFNGDQIGFWETKNSVVIAIVDGLGHGEEAEIAAKKAIDIISQNLHLSLKLLLRKCNEALRGSRGAAIAVSHIEKETGIFEYLSVGNTRCAIVSNTIQHLGGEYGIVGEADPEGLFFKQSLHRKDVLIFWTDGLPETLGLIAHEVRRIHNAQQFSDKLIKDHASNEDDAGVIVYRWDAIR